MLKTTRFERIVGKFSSLVILAHAPPDGNTNTQKDKFLDELVTPVRKAKNSASVVVGSDCNQRVGKRLLFK